MFELSERRGKESNWKGKNRGEGKRGLSLYGVWIANKRLKGDKLL